MTRSVVDIVMSEDISGLEEVEVVGYGTYVKWNVTGSIASADLSQSGDDIPSQRYSGCSRGTV